MRVTFLFLLVISTQVFSETNNFEKANSIGKPLTHPAVKIDNDYQEVIYSQNNLEKKYKELETKFDNLRLINQELKIENEVLAQSINMIKTELGKNADKQIKLYTLNSKLKQELDNGSQYSSWTGILLACVAIIVTVLGVGIALLAFFGFRNIKEAATKNAVKQSESQIGKAIQDGTFNELIYKAVERSIYRDILSESDFPDNDTRDDNENK